MLLQSIGGSVGRGGAISWMGRALAARLSPLPLHILPGERLRWLSTATDPLAVESVRELISVGRIEDALETSTHNNPFTSDVPLRTYFILFSSLTKAAATHKSPMQRTHQLEFAELLRESIDANGYGGEPGLLFSMQRFYATVGDFPKAWSVFESLMKAVEKHGWGLAPSRESDNPQRSFEHMLSFLVACGRVDYAPKVLKYLRRLECPLSSAAANSLIKVAAACDSLPSAFDVIEGIRARGGRPTLENYTALMRACVEAGQSHQVGIVLRQLKEDGIVMDLAAFGVAMDALGRCNAVSICLGLFAEMLEQGVFPDQGIYTCLIEATTRNNLFGLSFDLYNDMLAHNIPLDSKIYCTMMRLCLKVNSLDAAMQVHFRYIAQAALAGGPSGKLGLHDKGYALFLSMLLKSGREDLALQLLSEMVASGELPGVHTMRAWFSNVITSGQPALLDSFLRGLYTALKAARRQAPEYSKMRHAAASKEWKDTFKLARQMARTLQQKVSPQAAAPFQDRPNPKDRWLSANSDPSDASQKAALVLAVERGMPLLPRLEKAEGIDFTPQYLITVENPTQEAVLACSTRQANHSQPAVEDLEGAYPIAIPFLLRYPSWMKHRAEAQTTPSTFPTGSSSGASLSTPPLTSHPRLFGSEVKEEVAVETAVQTLRGAAREKEKGGPPSASEPWLVWEESSQQPKVVDMALPDDNGFAGTSNTQHEQLSHDSNMDNLFFRRGYRHRSPLSERIRKLRGQASLRLDEQSPAYHDRFEEGSATSRAIALAGRLVHKLGWGGLVRSARLAAEEAPEGKFAYQYKELRRAVLEATKASQDHLMRLQRDEEAVEDE